LRHLHSRAQHGSSDKQGRLLLPDDLCKQLDLKGEVALVGGRGRFEIWNLPRWKRAHAEEHATYQHVANLVGL
jgi:DNA-binding transcriptional regulator/RsmH inhibitor MraZ